MKKIAYSAVLLIYSFNALNITAQTEIYYDVFPLAKWNQYTYDYKFSDTTYYIGAFKYAQNDSGSLIYLIIDSIFTGNKIEWFIEQEFDLIRHYVTPLLDTIYFYKLIDTFKIDEDWYTGELITQSFKTPIWSFPSSDENRIYRYITNPSEIKSYSFGPRHFDSLWFNNVNGLSKRIKRSTYFGHHQIYTEMIANLVGSIVGISDLPNQNIDNFILTQNYPNPFNPSTKISWQSPVSGWQTLKVYDVLGNEVATLVNEYRPAGSYEIEFNPGSSIKHLPAGRQGPASGIFFYRLQAGDYVETKKMILLK